mmetsp:Transcript_30428/g.72400  ORF Transcript_30428/g.72400 Transcript_30428/m.72400 type:complete len:207 (+) Transcript_30428:299-919(+)
MPRLPTITTVPREVFLFQHPPYYVFNFPYCVVYFGGIIYIKESVSPTNLYCLGLCISLHSEAKGLFLLVIHLATIIERVCAYVSKLGRVSSTLPRCATELALVSKLLIQVPQFQLCPKPLPHMELSSLVPFWQQHLLRILHLCSRTLMRRAPPRKQQWPCRISYRIRRFRSGTTLRRRWSRSSSRACRSSSRSGRRTPSSSSRGTS